MFDVSRLKRKRKLTCIREYLIEKEMTLAFLGFAQLILSYLAAKPAECTVHACDFLTPGVVESKMPSPESCIYLGELIEDVGYWFWFWLSF